MNPPQRCAIPISLEFETGFTPCCFNKIRSEHLHGRVARCACGRWLFVSRQPYGRHLLRIASLDAVVRRSSKRYALELRMMGYRFMGEHPHRYGVHVYGKPIGYTLLTVSMFPEGATMELNFRGADDKFHVYSRAVKNNHEESLLEWLKYHECFIGNLSLYTQSPTPSAFHFLNKDDQADEMCGLIRKTP